MLQIRIPGFKIIELSPVRIIVFSYLLATIVATLLLLLPISLKEGVELTFTDTFFITVSAISATGLTVVNLVDTFSFFGIFILMFLMQFGGIGLMTLGTFVYVLLGRNIGLTHRQLIMIDQNRYSFTGLVQTIKLVFSFAIILEVIGALIFGSYFLFIGYSTSILKAYYYGLFHALSSFTNTGFDIFGNSLFNFSKDYFMQLFTIILLVLGSLGFPVLIELRAKLIGKNPHFRFSLYTKLTTITFFMLVFIGALSIYLLERNLFLANLPWHQKFFHSLFFSVTPRSGGLATLDINMFSNATLFFISVLMFIGASPSSVGGGIRTTTFAVVLLTIFNFSKGNSEVRVFNRRLANEDIIKSFVVLATALFLVTIAIILLFSVENYAHTFLSIIFEISSAFGTTGLSMGITPKLTAGGKYILIFLMFIGRIGIISFLWFLSTPNKKAKTSYPEEKIIIG